MATEKHEQLWKSYLEAYGPIADDEREQLLQESVADDVEFTNPGGAGKTRGDLIGHIQAFQKQMPGTFFKTDQLYRHHGELLAVWSMYKQDKSRVATGYNFVRLNPDERFIYMAGFF